MPSFPPASKWANRPMSSPLPKSAIDSSRHLGKLKSPLVAVEDNHVIYKNTRQRQQGYYHCKSSDQSPYGNRSAQKQKVIPAHFIQQVICEHNGKPVLNAYWGTAISKNPYLSFRIRGTNKGDALKLSWTDNTGQSDSTVAKIR